MATLPTLSPDFDWRAERLEWPVTTEVGPGLAGVVAAETEVMWLDPSSGRLAYRGVPIEALAGEPDFEAVAHLLISGRPPAADPEGVAEFRRRVRSSRELPPPVLALLRALDPATHPTRMLRAGISAVGCHELRERDDLEGYRHWQELRIVGQTAALVAEICRHRAGRPGRAPRVGCSLAEGVLAALADREPEPAELRALELLWVLYAAHGFDPPTFSSMVVASCLADPYANFVAGVSALRGPRTGGAAEEVLRQVLPLEGSGRAARQVASILAAGGVIAGFGHPTWHRPDPRVGILRAEVEQMARQRDREELFSAALAFEEAASAALSPRGVFVNINFYGALLFHLLGAEPALVPCLLAVGRMAGTAALVREALGTIRLYRPLSRYVGAPERRLADEAGG